jgi:heme exporter protein A
MLCLDKISIEVNNKTLLKDLSATILPGSITYFTGRNGIGKTSLLKVLASLKRHNSGEIKLYNLNLSNFHRPYCLYLSHNVSFENEMRIVDHLEFWASSYNSTEMIEAAVQYWDLDDYLEDYPSILSAGNAKKLHLSKLTCCYADVWLLDEVETNLDENNLKFLHNAIATKADSGGIIIMTTNSKYKMTRSQVIDLEDYKC